VNSYVPFGWQFRREGGPRNTLLEVTGRGRTVLDNWKWDGTPR
jgi:hypothetical protein